MPGPSNIVTLAGATSPQPSLAEKIAQLQAEAKALALEHTQQRRAAMAEVVRLSQEISVGGDSYAPGIRELARRGAEEVAARSDTLQAIMGRVS